MRPIRFIALLLSLVSVTAAFAAPSSATYVANIENQTQPSVHYTGRPWKANQAGYLEGIGQRAQLWGLPAPSAGDFRIDAEFKLPRAGKRSSFVIGPSSEIVFTSGGNTISLRGRFFQTSDAVVAVPVRVVSPTDALRMTVRRQGSEVAITYAGAEVYRGPCATGALSHAGFDPQEGAVQIYAFTAEGELPAHAAMKPFSNSFGMQLRRPPPRAAQVAAPVIVGQTPSQECSAITRRDGTLEVYFITKPESDSVSLIRSKDGGLTWSAPEIAFRLAGTAHFGIQALEDSEGAVHVVFHLFGQGKGGYKGRLYEIYHTRATTDGAWAKPRLVVPGYVGSLRGFVQLKSGRLLVGAGVAVPERENAPKSGPDLGWNDTVVYYSDDGVMWHQSPDLLQVELPGENNTRYGAIEPTLVELGDGRVWMLIRDRGGRLYESFSADGSRWSKAARTSFISSDSPAALLRLKDGRILIVWNPCQFWSDPRSYAMGGRDVLHAAISADDGKTWSGFREILHETDQVSGGDRGTAYPSPTETADGKILVVSGQGENKRAIVLFDPAWLLEKNASDDLEHGPVSWTQYGDEGLAVQPAPEAGGQCVAIPLKSSGLCGATFNFPATLRGVLTFRLWVPAEAEQIVLGLNDHFNRVDDLKAAEHLVFRADVAEVRRDSWQEVRVTWNSAAGTATLSLADQPAKTLRLQRGPASALNYLRIEARSKRNSGALKLAEVKVSASTDLGLMHNFDGDLSFSEATPELSKARVQQLVDEVARGPVQTVMWCIGAGSDILYYQTKVASTWGWRTTKTTEDPKWKTRIERARRATEAGLDAPRIVGERCRERGLNFFPSYRMNDGHFTADPLNYPLTGRFWMEHQNATIGKSPVAGFAAYQHLLNFARGEVRAYRLAVIFEAMERYADLMDGFELDFNRFQIFFPPGEAAQSAHLITEMVGQVRQRLNAIAAKQGRPMALVVRVPPALHNCTWSGLEVAEWMKQRLVDVVIPAQMMTLAHDMPVDEFARLAAPAGCQVFGSIYERGSYSWPFVAEHTTAAYAGEVTRTPDRAQVLGAILNQRHLGASGFQLFNFNFFHRDAAMISAVLSGLARRNLGDRRYQVTPSYHHDREDSYEYRKQLPAPLKAGERVTLRLLIGEDLAKAMPKPRYIGLRLGLSGANQAYGHVVLTVNLNGHRLHDGATSHQLIVTTGQRRGNGPHPPPTEAYLQWPITDGAALRPGWNTIDVILTSTPEDRPLQLVEAEVGVLAEA